MTENSGERPGDTPGDSEASPQVSGIAPGGTREGGAADDETDAVTFIERTVPSHRPGDA